MLIRFILAVTTFPNWDSKAESELKIRKFSSSLDSWPPFWKEPEKKLSKLAIHETPQLHFSQQSLQILVQRMVKRRTGIAFYVIGKWPGLLGMIKYKSEHIRVFAHFKTVSERIGYSKRGIHESLCHTYFWLVEMKFVWMVEHTSAL